MQAPGSPACNMPRGEDVGGHELGVLIEYVCDGHVSRDPIGPFITRHERAWAYCAGHGSGDHRWRHVSAIPRELLDVAGAKVELICGRRDHLDHGRDVPDGNGHVSVSGAKWAYCSAALNDTHDWRSVAPLEFSGIRHDGLDGLI